MNWANRIQDRDGDDQNSFRIVKPKKKKKKDFDAVKYVLKKDSKRISVRADLLKHGPQSFIRISKDDFVNEYD